MANKENKEIKDPIIILETSLYFERGKIFEEYESVDDGVLIQEHFIPKNQFVKLNEQLSPADEKRVKDLIRAQLKYFFWQLYTKQSFMLGNI